MTPGELTKILDQHRIWLLSNRTKGEMADLSRASLSRASLSGASLSRANLSGASLSRANLAEANLTGANLSGASLSRANLSGANLSGANLAEANLSWADLSGASLSWANLTRARLPRANLTGADLSGASLSGASGVTWAIVSWTNHGECGRDLLAVKIDGKIVFFCGCFQGSETDLLEFIQRGRHLYANSRRLALDAVKLLMADNEAAGL